jgi:hypothetical protein
MVIFEQEPRITFYYDSDWYWKKMIWTICT